MKAILKKMVTVVVLACMIVTSQFAVTFASDEGGDLKKSCYTDEELMERLGMPVDKALQETLIA